MNAIFDRGRLLNVAIALEANSAIAGLCASEDTTNYDQPIVNKRSRELSGRLDGQRRATFQTGGALNGAKDSDCSMRSNRNGSLLLPIDTYCASGLNIECPL
ncbi:hypothetical protein D7Y24_01115 [Stenotrophomonas maltophilia]|nr:hypothetical protein [Stenotrophomonas maltophilia]PZT04886.1 hypothetical protein A7X89_13245 [Stenotrophomonas maltophilia]HBP04074.1 hypothetical protein [Stenotrophomonas sp.]